MNDLIKEIEKSLENTRKLYEQVYESMPVKSYYHGIIVAYEGILKSLEDKNIITAPKEIKLSELIDKIYETKFKSECWVEPIKEGNNYYRIRVQYGDGYWGDYDFYIENEKIVIYTNDCLLPFNEFKWLYTLWIAETTIIDDLEGLKIVED